MKPYRVMTSAYIVLPEGEPMFSEMATTIELDDEGAGLFVVVSQSGKDEAGKISICPEEWPLIRDAIEQHLRLCKTQEA